jgi:hypothetical protein
MKSLLSIVTVLGFLSIASVASAETYGGIKIDDWKMHYGFSMDIGIPSGAGLGFVVHPKTDMLSLSVVGTYNGFGPGGRVGLKIDPLGIFSHWPIAVLADVQGGFATKGTLPGHSTDFPALEYQYVNFYGALRLGSPGNFHWLFEAGPTWLHATASNLTSVINNNSNHVTIGPASVTGWFVPTLSTGFEVTWQ